MSNIVLGPLAAVEQPIEYGWSPSRGAYAIRRWRGQQQQIESLVGQLQSDGFEYAVRGGPVWECTAQFGGDPDDPGNLVDQWELLPNLVEKDILESNLAIIDGLTSEQKSKLRAYAQSGTDDDFNAIAGTDAVTIATLIRAGVRSVRVHQPALRHTRTVSGKYAAQAAHTNVGRIIAPGSITSLEGVPAGVLFELPTGTNLRTDIAMNYGWLKDPPSVQQVAWSRWQISQEWLWGLWSEVLYGAPITT